MEVRIRTCFFNKDILGNAEFERRENLNGILKTPAALSRTEGTRGCSKKGILRDTVLFYLRLILKIKSIIYLYFP